MKPANVWQTIDWMQIRLHSIALKSSEVLFPLPTMQEGMDQNWWQVIII
jgi:hypothetical protein